MNTNITTDNYEAYLLDYMEGNLGPDATQRLQAFVAEQGLDWDELTAPLPYLEAPQIAYVDKERLKKKTVVVPLYAKIASAAAAAGLLLTVTLWPQKQLPKLEPLGDLKPIEVSCIETNEPMTMLPRRVTESINPMPCTSFRGDDMLFEATNKGQTVSERESMPLLAVLPSKGSTPLQTVLPLVDFDEPDFGLLDYRMNAHLAASSYAEGVTANDAEKDRDLSFISKAIFSLTEGRHDSFASLINSGIGKAKQDFATAATDAALTAYQRADERMEDIKEYWEEKYEK